MGISLKRMLISAIAVFLVHAPLGQGQALGQGCTWAQPDAGEATGASRTQTADKVLEGLMLVRTGQVYRLAHDYDELTIPLPFNRSFDVTEFPFDVSPAGPSQRFNDGFVAGNIGQLGTQFDGLGHAGHDFGFYNCLTVEEVGPDENGLLRRLDTASVRPFFTRGILLDFVNHSTVPTVTLGSHEIVEDSYVITRADINEVLRSEGLSAPREGDVVLFYTGWDRVFTADAGRLFFGPGPGVEAARWLAGRNVALVGADTQSVEATFQGASVELIADPDLLGAELGPVFNAVHFILLTENGIHLLENLRLAELADDLLAAFRSGRDPAGTGFRRGRGSPYEFLFVFAPVPIKGFESSPGQPLAVR